MLAALPEHLVPLRWAREGKSLRGGLSLSKMSRLAESLVSSSGEAWFDWHFRLDEEQRPVLEGRVVAELQLQCQRCLEPVTWRVETETRLGILRAGESEAHVPEGYDPLENGDQALSLLELVEDELILALPIIARHETCPRNEYVQRAAPQAEKPGKPPNPFEVLRGLKKD